MIHRNQRRHRERNQKAKNQYIAMANLADILLLPVWHSPSCGFDIRHPMTLAMRSLKFLSAKMMHRLSHRILILECLDKPRYWHFVLDVGHLGFPASGFKSMCRTIFPQCRLIGVIRGDLGSRNLCHPIFVSIALSRTICGVRMGVWGLKWYKSKCRPRIPFTGVQKPRDYLKPFSHNAQCGRQTYDRQIEQLE